MPLHRGGERLWIVQLEHAADLPLAGHAVYDDLDVVRPVESFDRVPDFVATL